MISLHFTVCWRNRFGANMRSSSIVSCSLAHDNLEAHYGDAMKFGALLREADFRAISRLWRKSFCTSGCSSAMACLIASICISRSFLTFPSVMMAPVDALRNTDTGEEGESPRKIDTGALFPLWGDGELFSADCRTGNRPSHSLVSIRSSEHVARNMRRTSLPIRSIPPLDQGA